MPTHLSSATATALSNSDLLFALFEHLAPFSHADILQPDQISSQHFPKESCLRRQTLINAALTCRDFAEPASSVLWRVLYPGLHPLFYPFPGFHQATEFLEIRELDDYEQQFLAPIPNHILDREPSPAEWERWRICARRVRCITLQNTRAAFFDEPFIPLLLHASAEIPILPSIQSIAFNEPRGDVVRTQLLHALIGPALSTISVYNVRPYAYSAHILDDLEVISRTSNNVQRMLIRSENTPLSQNWPITRFPRLRMLSFDCLSWFPCRSMTSQLGALQELEELDITYEAISSNPQIMAALDNPSPTNAFPALRKLHLGASAFQASQIIPSISSTSLQEVRIGTHQPAFRADVTALLQTFPWTQNASSLRQLDLTHTTNWGTLTTSPGDPFYAALFDMFAPLAELHALEYLEISCWNRVLSVSDADVARMGRAWPRLRRIVIAYTVEPIEPAEPPIWDPYGPQVARPSLSALADLAERCPALFYCEIPAASVSEPELAALEARAADSEAHDRPRQANLRSLLPARGVHCLHFTLCDVDRVARALLALFPSLYGVGRTGLRRPSLELRWPSQNSWNGQQRQTDGFRLLERLFELSGQVETFDD